MNRLRILFRSWPACVVPVVVGACVTSPSRTIDARVTFSQTEVDLGDSVHVVVAATNRGAAAAMVQNRPRGNRRPPRPMQYISKEDILMAHHRTARILSAVLLTSLIPASHARAQSPLQSSRPVEIGTEFTLSSSVFGTQRRIIVVTPPDYADTDYAYPIVYSTDGSQHTLTKAGIVAFQQFTAHMPGAIFVGIVNEDRMGDMTPTHVSESPTSGGGPRLLEFILNEVHPFVAARHRVHDHRTLVGHSLGGLFTINAVLEQPDAFDNYLAIAPALWYDDEVTLRKATEALSSDTAFNGSLYLTIGGNDGYGMRMELQRFVHLLEALAPSTLRWTHDVVPGEEHESTVLLSWFRGLRWLFRDIALTEALRESPDPTAIRAHLERADSYTKCNKVPQEER